MIRSFDVDVSEILSEKQIQEIHQNVARKFRQHTRASKTTPTRFSTTPTEVLIPCSRNLNLKTLPREKLIKMIEGEFAARYLELIGVEATKKNVIKVLELVPLHKCKITIRKGGLKGCVLAVTPQLKDKQPGGEIKESVLDPLKDFNLRDALTKPEKYDLTGGKGDKIPSNDEMYKYLDIKILRQKSTENKEKIRLRPFDEYKYDYVYPFCEDNLKRGRDPETYSTSIFSKIWEGDENSGRYIKLNLTREDLEKELDDFPQVNSKLSLYYQQKFSEEFPWANNVTKKDRNALTKKLTGRQLSDFILQFCRFSYWRFLHEFYLYDDDDQYDPKIELIELFRLILVTFEKKHKLNIVLLCVKVVNETLFRQTYPLFFSTLYGNDLILRMNELLLFLVDPHYYNSFFFINSNMLGEDTNTLSFSHKIKSGMNEDLGRRGKTDFASMNVSPFIQIILGKPRSTGARVLINRNKTKKRTKKRVWRDKNEKNEDQFDRHVVDAERNILSDLLSDVKVRSKLLAILIRRKEKMVAKGRKTYTMKKNIFRPWNTGK